MVNEPAWNDSVDSLRDRTAVPAAQAAARLLQQAEDRWEGRVVARMSMHDLLFTVPGQAYPFEEEVRVSWTDGVFEFVLTAQHGKVVAGDRCRETAPLVLDAFLSQLVGDP